MTNSIRVSGLIMGGLAILLTIQARAQLLTQTQVRQGDAPLAAVDNIAISPDGADLYSANSIGHTVGVFGRNQADGMIAFESSEDTQAVVSLGYLGGVIPSPDGAHLYTSTNSDGLIIWNRNATTGALTFNSTLFDSTIDGPFAFAPDASKLFFASQPSVNVDYRAYIRTPATGALVAANAGVTLATSENPLAAVLSPNEANLYLTTNFDKLNVYTVNAVSGDLTFLESHTDEVLGVDGLADPVAMAVSNDGRHVYVLGKSDAAIAFFSRNETTGALSYLERISAPSVAFATLNGATDMEISPGGDVLIVSGATPVAKGTFTQGSIVAFARNEASGALTFIEKLEDNTDNVNGIAGASSVSIAPDGEDVYVASPNDSAISVFQIGQPTTLNGKLTDGGGFGLNCGVVELTSLDDGSIVTGLTDRNGNYTIRNLRPGFYSLRAFAFSYSEFALGNVDLTVDATHNLVLLPISTADAITGTVTDVDTGDPLSGVRVQAFVNGMLTATSYTCADGRYQLTGFRSKGIDVFVNLIFNLANYAQSQEGVNVPPDGGVLVNQSMQKNAMGAATVTGQVASVNPGSPLASALIELQGPVNASTNSSGAGAFDFASVLGGAYTVRASAAGHVTQEVGVAVPMGGLVVVPQFVLQLDAGCTPAAPSGVNASDGTFNDRVRVTWSSVAGATSYQVFRNNVNNSAGAVLLGSVPGTTFDDFSAKTAAVAPMLTTDTDRVYSVIPIAVLVIMFVLFAIRADRGRLRYATAAALICIAVTLTSCPPPPGNGGGGGGQPDNTFFYWVKAVNVCGESNFSSANSGFKGP